MNKLTIFFIAVLTILAISIAIWGIPMARNPNDAKIATTIFPIYDITQNIVGDTFTVALILPTGASPHTYEPTPSNIKSLSNAKVMYMVGHNFDDWANAISTSVGADLVIVDSNINIKKSHESEDIDDPHYWLTIKNAKQIARNITNDLKNRYPDLSDIFEQNLNLYLKQLDETNTEMQNLLSESVELENPTMEQDLNFINSHIENKNIITMHDAWWYFTDAYNLNLVGTFEPTAGREPTPQYITKLTNAVTSTNVSVIYSEPQFDKSILESFTKDNDLTIAALDPLGGSEETNSYIKLMLYNAETIAQNQ